MSLNKKKWFFIGCFFLFFSYSSVDATQRIVSLAPNLTEILYEIGCGPEIVGVSAYSNYPFTAKKLPVVSDSKAIDFERIALLKPNLIVAWNEGQSRYQIEHLKSLGYHVEVFSFVALNDIPKAMQRLGFITHHVKESSEKAQKLHEIYTELFSKAKASSKKLRPQVFFEIWPKPLITVGKRSYINDIIQRCGGKNIFDSVEQASFQVSKEAIILKDPDLILFNQDAHSSLSEWLKFQNLKAIQKHQVYPVSPDLISRPGPRIWQGVAQICDYISKNNSQK